MKRVMSMMLAVIVALTYLAGCSGKKGEEQVNRYTDPNGMYAISLPGKWTEEDNMNASGVFNLARKDGAGILVIGVAKGESLFGYGPDVNSVDELLEYTSAMFLNQGDNCKTVLSDDEPILSDGFIDVVAKEGLMTQAEGSNKVFVQCAETEKAYYMFFMSVNERYDHYEKYEKIMPSLKKQMVFEELEIPEKAGLSDTWRWFNASYAVIITQNGGNLDIAAGFEANGFYKELFAAVLERDWGITDRKSLEETVDGLLAGRHNPAALRELGQFGSEGMSRDDLIAAMNKGGVDAADRISLLAVFDARAAYGDQAIAGWDLSRAMQLIGWGYVAGYYTYEESVDESVEAAKIIRQKFNSWEDFLKSYLYGYSYWSGGDLADTSSAAYGRKEIYENLKAAGVYDVDWNLEF